MNGLRIAAFLGLTALLLPAQELRDYEKKATEFTLSNGLHFILLERHQVPVVSFHTYLNAGSVQDPTGGSGLANLLAKLAFDGTETIGTKDWPAEKKALEDVELAYDRLDEERGKGSHADAGAMAALDAGVSSAVRAAQEHENRDEFTRALQTNGAVRVNSHATQDSIEVSYSLPSNRIELWFLLESQRLAHPVFRNFYKERQALATESAALSQSRGIGRLRQALLSTAFEDLAYRNPLPGWPGDVGNLRVSDAKNFLSTYGGPGNLVISIVGDVDPGNARLLADKYFGPILPKPHPPAPQMHEVQQMGPKTVSLWSDAPPVLMVGYKRPSESSRDDIALDFLEMILGDRQTGWIHKELVDGKRIAQDADVTATFPSGRFTNLFVLTVTPAHDHTVEENRKAIDDLIARLQSRMVDDETLSRVKSVLRVRAAQTLSSNERLAALLPLFHARYGDWRKLFSILPQYDQMTAADLQRVALQYLNPFGRTVATITGGQEPAPASLPGGQR